MKNYAVKYQNGHFVRADNGKIIKPKAGATFYIASDNENFLEADFLTESRSARTTAQIEYDLEKKKSVQEFHNMLSAGTRLMISFGISKKDDADKDLFYQFGCRLLEDLFLVKGSGKGLALADCLCITEECLSRNIDSFDPVYGESLSSLYANTVSYYFSGKRSTAGNSFKEFKVIDHEKHGGKKLDDIREMLKSKFLN